MIRELAAGVGVGAGAGTATVVGPAVEPGAAVAGVAAETVPVVEVEP